MPLRSSEGSYRLQRCLGFGGRFAAEKRERVEKSGGQGKRGRGEKREGVSDWGKEKG